MGANMDGQCGVREIVGAIDDKNLYVPSQILFSEKVKDFAVGQNSLAILSDNNKVFFSGIGLTYKPQELYLPANVVVK